MTQRTRGRPRWGQNFLVAPDVARHIVDWADVSGRRVLEIGPGRGALTGLLLERAAFLRVVEIDSALVAELHRACGHDPRLEIVPGDALELEVANLLEPGMIVVANLPYESATAIIQRLLAADPSPASMVVMVQREVCRRLAAVAGDREYGLLALHTRLRADVEMGKVVPPGCFRPSPKVDSQLVCLRPLGRYRWDIGDPVVFSQLASAVFRARRKMLRNTLVPFVRGKIGDAADGVLTAAEVDLALRPERVTLEQFARLSSLVSAELSARA